MTSSVRVELDVSPHENYTQHASNFSLLVVCSWEYDHFH